MNQPTVRAKFRLNSFTTEMHVAGYENGPDDKPDYKRPIKVEKRTLNFTPVYSDDPKSENKSFWDASPSGSLQLGVVNQQAWSAFELDKEYYLDFTAAN